MGTPKKPKPPKMKTRLHVSVPEAATLLGLHRNTIVKLISQKDLDAFKITLGITGPWRVYVDSIEEFRRKRGERE